MNIKGLDHIPKPLARVASRTAPRSREQILSELACLQRQEGRLEKKLKVSRSIQKQTERHLSQVQNRRAFLERVLDQKDTERRSPSAERKSGDDGGRKAPIRSEIPQSLAPKPEPQPEPQPEPWERQPPITLERQRLRHRAARR